jgi:hypothetical protein
LISIANIISLLVYIAVIYQLRRLSTNRFVLRCEHRQRQMKLVKMFAWVTLSDLLLEVLPHTFYFFWVSAGGNEFVKRFNVYLLILNRCVNLFVYMWKFHSARRMAWKLLSCEWMDRKDGRRRRNRNERIVRFLVRDEMLTIGEQSHKCGCFYLRQ